MTIIKFNKKENIDIMANVILYSKKVNSVRKFGIKLSLFLMALISFTNQSFAQTDCNQIMACNNLVQISLATNCTETIIASMILEKANLPSSSYEVITKTKTGVVLPNNLLTRTSIGVEYDVSVSVRGCGISCWGSITVEDKLPPVISNCPSVTVNCGQSVDPDVLARPTAIDACGTTTMTHSDVVKVSQCTDQFVKVINRTWTAVDLQGNKSTCVQLINVIRPTIADVTFPSNYDDIDRPAFSCGAITNLLPNGAPSPDITGRPGGADCPNIMFYYEDVLFPICGEAKKILRKWNVIDWCTGKDSSYSQIIKILDKAPPVCVSSPDFLYRGTTDEGKCTGTFRVPAPTVIYECSAYTYEVAYKLRGPDGRPFVNPTTEGITKTTTDTGYYYTIPNLPADTTWIIYTITDACDNTTQCFTEILIEDKEAPTAVCEGYNIVSLDDSGFGAINATSVNAGSNDNCSIAKLEVKRLVNNCGRPQDLNFRDQVSFCCSDISATNPYQTVILRVYDHIGNFSDCTSNVKVQDKRNPIISVVPDIAIDCGVDHRNTSITGRPTFSDNCTVRLDSTDSGSLVCGQGIITRTWKVTDTQGLTATSVQTITVRDLTPFGESNITWPSDLDVNGCKVSDAHPDIIAGRPTFTNVECADIAMSFNDQEFIVPGACLKILRTWRIVNWCNANAQSPNYITHVQKILLKNSVAPTITSGCEQKVFTAANSDCSAFVEHKVSATDDCTTQSDIKFTWSLDANNNGTIDGNGTSNAVSRVYPVGTHRITFTATDGCLNSSSCSYLFTIKDQKAPTPICNTSLVTTLNDQKQAEIWASDFNHKSFDLCDTANLTFTFDSLGSVRGRMFTCSDITNGVSQSIPLKVWVADRSNNRDFCEVNLVLQDPQNKNLCPNTGNLTANIYGKVENKSSIPFNQLAIQLESTDNNKTVSSMTNTNGQFEFNSVAFFDGYALKPKKLDDIFNGVSTLDLVFIQRHILGIKTITDPYDLIAADINGDKKLTASDLVALRKVILGIESNFPNNEPWKFIPSKHEFANQAQPWDYPTQVIFDQLESDAKDNDFIALKVGDVNNSAVISALSKSSELRTKSVVNVNVNKLNNSLIELSFIVNDRSPISGFQFGMDLGLDKNASIEKIISEDVAITNENITLKDGNIKISYHNSTNSNVTSSHLFKVVIKSTLISEQNLRNFESFNEVYDANYNVIPVELIVDGKMKTDELVTISPNPFSHTSTITYNSDDEEDVKFSIVDITGKTVYETLEKSQKGSNTISINRSQLGSKAGIYFFNIQKMDLKYTGALILAE